MKRLIVLIITVFIMFFKAFLLPALAEVEPLKIMSLNYDNSSSVVCITTKDDSGSYNSTPQKYVRLTNPNRIYFDVNDAVLIGEKQQLVFDKSPIKEIKLAQFSTNPNVVRTVITFEEDFDTSKIKLLSSGGNIIAKISSPKILNDYFNPVYDENAEKLDYSSLTVNSEFIKRVAVPVEENNNKTLNEIQSAFEGSTLPKSDGKTYDSVVSVDLSSTLKLRTKYFIDKYLPKNNGLLVSGIGQLSTSKIFVLNSPKRMVIDLPNTYLAKEFRNKEISLCPTGTCKDSAKIGQFEYNTARIVITSDDADKYLPIFSNDAQSLFIVNADKLNHTSIAQNISNINKAYVKKINNKTSELVLSFSSPVVHSIVRTDNSLKLCLFNVKSYNEEDISRTLNNSVFKKLSLSLFPQIGVKAELKIDKDDKIKIEQSIDSKAMKITITKNNTAEITNIPKKTVKKKTKNKVVLDPGHGGTDYGAIREGINEKDITLDVSRRVEALLKAKGYKVAMTRKEDVFVSLEDRVTFSEEEEPEIFVSIHVNSAVSTDPNGIETHWYHDYSKSLAETIHKRLMDENPNSKDRGLFKSKFYVINHTTVPAILCEIGFISNENERNELITDSRKQRTAKAIADGIIEYLKGSK